MDTTTFTPVNGAALGPPGRRTVLDDAHAGDIRGALGTLGQHAHLPRSRRHRLLALLAIMGPGLIVVIGFDWSGSTHGTTSGKDRAAVMYAWSVFSARSSRS